MATSRIIIQDHPDQGVVILVRADVADKETTLLRFNCFDFERSYVYGPENADLRAEGPAMLGGAATTNLYRMDSTVDGNPIGWTIRTLGTKLPRMLGRAGYSQIAELVDMAAVTPVPPNYVRRSATPSSTTAAPISSRLATSDFGSK